MPTWQSLFTRLTDVFCVSNGKARTTNALLYTSASKNPQSRYRDGNGCLPQEVGSNDGQSEVMDSKAGGHIYLLELKAAGLAPRSFVSNDKNKHILIRMEGSNSLCDAKGGTRSKALNQEALEIWGWCLKRNLTIQAEHVPEILNTEADFESRHLQDPSDWMLQPSLFATIQAL